MLSPHSQVPMVPGPDSGPTAPAVFYALISPLCSTALSLPLAPQPPPPFIPCQRSWVGEGPPLPAWRSFICNLMLAPGTRGQGHCWNERGGQRGLLEEGDGGREDGGGRVRALSLCSLNAPWRVNLQLLGQMIYPVEVSVSSPAQ